MEDCISSNNLLVHLQETVKDREAWYAAVHGLQRLDTTEQLNNNNNGIKLTIVH